MRGDRGGRSAAPLAPGASLSAAPAALAIESVSPNPSGGRVRVAFATPDDGPVQVEVFDVRGRLVVEETVTGRGAGRHAVALGSDGLVPGVYLVRVTSGGASAESRFTVAR